jgi:hypothetical protein
MLTKAEVARIRQQAVESDAYYKEHLGGRLKKLRAEKMEAEMNETTLTPTQIERRQRLLREVAEVNSKIYRHRGLGGERDALVALQGKIWELLAYDPPDDAAATAQRLRMEAAQRRHRQRTAPPSAPSLLEMVEHRERNAARVLALQALADACAGAAMGAIEAERGIIKAQIAERIHAVLLGSQAWRGYLPPEKLPRGE